MKKTDIALVALGTACVLATVPFGIPGLISYPDETAGKLVSETAPRLIVGAFLLFLLLTHGFGAPLRPRVSGKNLLWSLPCLLVALVNFPFSALIRGTATVERVDLLWLFLLKCCSVALFEECFFRGLLVPLFYEKCKKNAFGVPLSAALSAAIFGAVHLFNLFSGAGVGATFLQVGYCFLIGFMLAVTLLRTGDLWLCVAIHALFDVGGMIVTDLGSGAFQDAVFWGLTVAAGVLCAVHILMTTLALVKRDQSRIS